MSFSSKILIFVTILLGTLPVYAQDAEEIWEGAYTSDAFAGGAIREVYCAFEQEAEGSFGALTFIVSGMLAFGMAAFGDNKRAFAAMMVAVAGATVGTGVSLYFGDLCGAGGGGTTRTTAEAFDGLETDLSSEQDLFLE